MLNQIHEGHMYISKHGRIVEVHGVYHNIWSGVVVFRDIDGLEPHMTTIDVFQSKMEMYHDKQT